jgi:hypothetical protein
MRIWRKSAIAACEQKKDKSQGDRTPPAKLSITHKSLTQIEILELKS